MTLIRPLFLIIILAVLPLAAQAEIYEPGRGILLPKRQQDKEDKKNSDKAQDNKTISIRPNQNQSGPAIVKQGGIVQKNNAPIIVQPSSRNQDDTAQKLTTAYATHVYSGFCAQQYRDLMVTKTEENINRKRMISDMQANCKCMANQILLSVPASDLADYVMYNYGDQSATPDARSVAFLGSSTNLKIEMLSLNGELRKKCGFLK